MNNEFRICFPAGDLLVASAAWPEFARPVESCEELGKRVGEDYMMSRHDSRSSFGAGGVAAAARSQP